MCTRPARPSTVPWLATYDAGCLDPANHCARLLGVDQLEEPQRQHPLNLFGWSVEWGGWCCSGEGDRRTDEELSGRLGLRSRLPFL